jgi:glucose/arabinose dehydrogenase
MQNWRWSRGIRRRAGWVLSLLLLLGVPWAQAQELLIGSVGTDQVLRYDGQTGAFRDAFVAAGSGGLSAPVDLVFGPDGALYVADANTAQVLRYDGQTGAFRDAFVAAGSGGLQFPDSLVFGPDGALYVSSVGTAQVLR